MAAEFVDYYVIFKNLFSYVVYDFSVVHRTKNGERE